MSGPAFTLVGRRRSFVMLLLRATVAILLWGLVPVGFLALVAYGELVRASVIPESLVSDLGPTPSVVLDAYGLVVGGPIQGPLGWASLDEVSPAAVRAILASEDAAFYVHGGFSLRGIARAAVANRAAGRAVQGGSTITQQLAKTYVGNARSLDRKLTELVVARRLEARFSKAEILEAYLNRTYFGAGATGIRAAAMRYFGTTPDRLSLAQGALLAALVPAPSRHDPFGNPAAIRVRRDRVLDRLEATGLATVREVAIARATPLQVVPAADRMVAAPEVERAVWRALSLLDPQRSWRTDGLVVQSTVQLARQRHAQAVVRDELWALDQRQGLRAHLGWVADADRAIVRQRIAAWRDAHPSAFVQPALVEEVETSQVSLFPAGADLLPRAGWSWAVPWQADARNHAAQLTNASEAFATGDVVLRHPRLGIVQWPRVEAAYGSLDLVDGALDVLVGGFDPQRGEFDRFVQGCRQPGSTFKPFVYAVALANGDTPATVVRDGPLRMILGPFQEWRPRNADGRFAGHMTVWEAVIRSRNLPVLAIQDRVGRRAIIDAARRMGIRSPIRSVDSLGLGASCVPPVELLAAYGTLARIGAQIPPWGVASATPRVDRVGTTWVAPLSMRVETSPAARLRQVWHRRSEQTPAATSRVVGYQLSWLLRDVVRFGTGNPLARIGFPVAGKTGTTNRYDAWFAGYTAREAAVLWVGADRNDRALGRDESGGRLAVPAWGAALLPVDADLPILPEMPPGLELLGIDPETGQLAPDDGWSVVMPFRLGSGPRRTAPTEGERMLFQADRLLRRW